MIDLELTFFLIVFTLFCLAVYLIIYFILKATGLFEFLESGDE